MATRLNDILLAMDRMYSHREAKEQREADRSLSLLTTQLSLEARETEAARGVLLKEYYDKKDEIAKTEDMYDKYTAVDPTYKTPDAMDLINIVSESEKIDMSALTKNLDMMSTYQSDLKQGLTELESQGQKLKELQSEFWGVNRTLQPHEYYADPSDDVEQFQEYALKSKDEGGLGLTSTAGMDYAYSQRDPLGEGKIGDIAMQRGNIIKAVKEKGAVGSYAVMQGFFGPNKEGDAFDPNTLQYVDAEGKAVEPTDEMVTALQGMFTQEDYDDFMTNFYAYEALKPEAAAQLREVLEQNPSLKHSFFNLERDYADLKALENEAAGINTPKAATALESFATEVTEVGAYGPQNKEELYDKFTTAMRNIPVAEHDDFFAIVEKQLGVSDASADYLKYLNEPKDDPNTPPPKTLGEKYSSVPLLQGMGWTVEAINEELINQGVDIYNLAGIPLNYLTTLLTGYNPGYQGTKFFETMTGTSLEESRMFGPEVGEIFGAAPGEFTENNPIMRAMDWVSRLARENK